MNDTFTRLCGTGQDLTNVTTAGVLSTAWLDLGDGTKRAFGGGRLVVASFVPTVSFNSETENATVDLQIVHIPKTSIATFTFTGEADDDKLTAAAHGLIDGTRITVANSGGALPTGLAASTNYYVRDATTNTFKVALTPGGAAIDITGDGSGTQTATWYPEVLVSAQTIGIDRLMAGLGAVEIGLPPPQGTRGYPVGRYLFARFVPSATLTAGTIVCDLNGGYAQDAKPFNKPNYVTA